MASHGNESKEVTLKDNDQLPGSKDNEHQSQIDDDKDPPPVVSTSSDSVIPTSNGENSESSKTKDSNQESGEEREQQVSDVSRPDDLIPESELPGKLYFITLLRSYTV